MAAPRTSSLPSAQHLGTQGGRGTLWPAMEAIVIMPAILDGGGKNGLNFKGRSALMKTQREGFKQGLTEGLKYHHKKAMSRKFNPATQKEYRFKPRRATYQQWKKDRKKGRFYGRKGGMFTEFLVKSGELKRKMTSQPFKPKMRRQKGDLKGDIRFMTMFFKLSWPKSFSASHLDHTGRGGGDDQSEETRRFRSRKRSRSRERTWKRNPPNVKKRDIRNELVQWAPRDESMAAKLFQRAYIKVLRRKLSLRQKKTLRPQLLAEGIRIKAGRTGR